MKHILRFLMIAVSLPMLLIPASAAPSFSENDLTALNMEHVRIVRQAQRACAANFHRGFTRQNHRNPCVVGEVERRVRSLDRPSLLRFHRQLPMRHRFDPHRDMNNVRRFFN